MFLHQAVPLFQTVQNFFSELQHQGFNFCGAPIFFSPLNLRHVSV